MLNEIKITHTDGDTLCYIDFRADRMREINEATGIKPPFETAVIPQNLVSNSLKQLKVLLHF